MGRSTYVSYTVCSLEMRLVMVATWMLPAPHDVSVPKTPSRTTSSVDYRTLAYSSPSRMSFTSSSILFSRVILQAFTNYRRQIHLVRLSKQWLKTSHPCKRRRAVSTIFRTSRTSRGTWRMDPSKWHTLTRGARAYQTVRAKYISAFTDNQHGLTSIDE